VNLCGRDLPPELAQDAKARLRTLALAVRARLRAAGRKVALGFVEARVFVRLMDGTHAGAPDAEVIAAVTTELTTTPGPGPGPGPGRVRSARRRVAETGAARAEPSAAPSGPGAGPGDSAVVRGRRRAPPRRGPARR
jgi:hypothetical protein